MTALRAFLCFSICFTTRHRALELAAERKELLQRFERSALLAAKSPKQRRHLLRGDKVMFSIQDEVVEAMGVDKVEFRAGYEVLSSHVHSFPLAFHRMLMDGRGTGVENDIEKVWTSTTLDYLQGFLARAATQMLGLFPDVPDPRLAVR